VLARDGLHQPNVAAFITVLAGSTGIQVALSVAARTLHVPAQQAEEAATREADATARQAVADRIRSARQARWLELRATAEPLLSGLAAGTADPADRAVQRACAVEAARLRRLFAEADDTPDPLVHELHACADVAQRLLEDGYVAVADLLSPAEVAAARADLGRILQATPTGRNDFEGRATQRVYALFAKTRTFDRAATGPLLLDVLDRVLENYQLSAPVGIRIGPGEKAQILHRDDAVYPLPEPHPPVVVNTMWPLDEFTAQNGATRFIPGSHRWEPGRTPAADDPVAIATMSPGSVMFYLGSLWHGGGANQTGRARLGVILEYASAWLRPQENHCLAVPRPVVRRLPERLQELLGYNIYPPFLGYVDGGHPRKALSADE